MLFEKQKYQEDCVNNIMKILESTDNLRDFSSLKESIKELQQKENIPESHLSTKSRLDVLMETGTGKTFTYLKTMYEMNKNYGINKFVVFVPRLAIKSCILQNIDLTSDYFFHEYHVRIKKHIYGDKSGLNQVLDYIRNKQEFSVLILTSASITGNNEADRKLRRRNESLLYEQKSPLSAIGELSPVIFIDEPHLLKGASFVNTYECYFSKSLCLRFGATFPTDNDFKLSNVVYMLDSITAFRDYLVKKIKVSTIIDRETGIKFYKGKNPNTLCIHFFKDGEEFVRDIRCKENIEVFTGKKEHDFHVVRLKKREVFLSNGTKRSLSSNDYQLNDLSIHTMVKQAIEIHFNKEEILFKKGIKTLSLFFIPNISDYRGGNPRIKNIFEEEYKRQRKVVLKKKLSSTYRDYLQKDYNDNNQLRVHEGYFSGDKGSRETKESEGVDLILNEKEKLLSTKEPLRFIFSVWALQEGWDNPNIFTICKLASTDQETSRRQQVGRGLRLAVDQEGKRQTIGYCENNESNFYNINMLDIIVSGQEENFVEEIQNEIVGNSITYQKLTRNMLKAIGLTESHIGRLIVYLEDANVISPISNADGIWKINDSIYDFLQEQGERLQKLFGKEMYEVLIQKFKRAVDLPVINANRIVNQVGIRQEKFKEFESLWETITRKARIRYHNIDEKSLIRSVRSSFEREDVHPVEKKIKRHVYNHNKNRFETVEENPTGYARFFTRSSYKNFIGNFAKRENLPIRFCCEMFNMLSEEKIKKDPTRAQQLLTTIFKDEIHKVVVQSISYAFENEVFINARNIFYQDEEYKICKKKIDAHQIGRYVTQQTEYPAENYLYDKIVYDSSIEKEVAKTEPLKIGNKKIVVFAKLPKISIPTPYKSYSPDFAYYIRCDSGKKLFLIVETKGYDRQSRIPDEEQRKIEYATKFFEAVNQQNDSVEVVFKKRINKEELTQLLKNINGC